MHLVRNATSSEDQAWEEYCRKTSRCPSCRSWFTPSYGCVGLSSRIVDQLRFIVGTQTLELSSLVNDCVRMGKHLDTRLLLNEPCVVPTILEKSISAGGCNIYDCFSSVTAMLPTWHPVAGLVNQLLPVNVQSIENFMTELLSMTEANNKPTVAQVNLEWNSPVICQKCNMKNDYGSPNGPGNTYTCYNCR